LTKLDDLEVGDAAYQFHQAFFYILRFADDIYEARERLKAKNHETDLMGSSRRDAPPRSFLSPSPALGRAISSGSHSDQLSSVQEITTEAGKNKPMKDREPTHLQLPPPILVTPNRSWELPDARRRNLTPEPRRRRGSSSSRASTHSFNIPSTESSSVRRPDQEVVFPPWATGGRLPLPSSWGSNPAVRNPRAKTSAPDFSVVAARTAIRRGEERRRQSNVANEHGRRSTEIPSSGRKRTCNFL
jgi:hypothetical protein